MVLRVSLKYFLFVEDFALGKNLEMIESLRIINLIHEYIEWFHLFVYTNWDVNHSLNVFLKLKQIKFYNFLFTITAPNLQNY